MADKTLDHIFSQVPPQFVFLKEDYDRLVRTNRRMRDAMKLIETHQRVKVKRKALLNTQGDGEIVLDVGLPQDPGIVVDHAEFEVPGLDDGRAEFAAEDMNFDTEYPYIWARLPSLPNMRSLKFQVKTPGRVVQGLGPNHKPQFAGPQLELSSLPNSLINLTIQSYWHFESHEGAQYMDVVGTLPLDKRCQIFMSPGQNISTLLPRLVSLNLFSVCCRNFNIVLPQSLRNLRMSRVIGLRLEELPPKLEYLRVGKKVEGQPMAIPTNIPASVYYLSVPVQTFLHLDIPIDIEELHLLGEPVRNFDDGMVTNLDSAAISAKFASCQFQKLQVFTADEVPFDVLPIPPSVTQVELCLPKCQRITFENSSLRKLYIACEEFAEMSQITIPPTTELIRLHRMTHLERVVIPPACRKLDIDCMTRLEEIIFDSCIPRYIHFCALLNLQVVRSVNGAVIPDDTPMLTAPGGLETDFFLQGKGQACVIQGKGKPDTYCIFGDGKGSFGQHSRPVTMGVSGDGALPGPEGGPVEFHAKGKGWPGQKGQVHFTGKGKAWPARKGKGQGKGVDSLYAVEGTGRKSSGLQGTYVFGGHFNISPQSEFDQIVPYHDNPLYEYDPFS